MIGWQLGNTPDQPGEYVVSIGGSRRLATWYGRWYDGYRFIDPVRVRAYLLIPDETDCEGVR